MPVKLFSPAKVNLCLNVLGKRKDGYHELETVFERIGLGDRLTLSERPDGIRLRVQGQKVPAGPTNLVWRAAELLQRRYRVQKGVAIVLEKNIPVAAGLGGGSSNAAAALLGLNRLWKLRLSRATLLKLGAELGSDVPFFILETPFALGTGRGEKLKKIASGASRFWHVVVRPDFGISTQEAYAAVGAPSLTLPRADVKIIVQSIRKGDPQPLASLLSNSLELALNKRLTTISKIKKSLLTEGALGALLSGSGSCVFGLFPSEGTARRAARRLRRSKRTWKVFVASTY
jgi:4-diphosphocytidyl-2-C-methyl-D-erythritol kinase